MKQCVKAKCRDCDEMEWVKRSEWVESKNPRCCLCGGLLERVQFRPEAASDSEYGPEWTQEVKQAVRRRDGQCCLICGRSNAREASREGHGLSVHHIDHDKANCRMSNLATVCNACHNRRTHGTKAEAWKSTLKEILAGGNKRHVWVQIKLGPISNQCRKHKRRIKKQRAKKKRAR